MRDVFYTLLVVWIIYRIMSGLNAARPRQAPPKTNITNPPKKKNPMDEEGEYVDFEEIK
jgi:hypothetical protein